MGRPANNVLCSVLVATKGKASSLARLSLRAREWWATTDAPFLLNGRPEITIVADEINDPRRAPYLHSTLCDPGIRFIQQALRLETERIGDPGRRNEDFGRGMGSRGLTARDKREDVGEVPCSAARIAPVVEQEGAKSWGYGRQPRPFLEVGTCGRLALCSHTERRVGAAGEIGSPHQLPPRSGGRPGGSGHLRLGGGVGQAISPSRAEIVGEEREWAGWQGEGVPRHVGVPTAERAKGRAEKAKSADEIARKKGELRMRHAGRSV